MSSDSRFGDEPSMAEILASVRRIVAEDQGGDKTKTANSSTRIEPRFEAPLDVSLNIAESSDAPSSRGDVLQRLLNKQAENEKQSEGYAQKQARFTEDTASLSSLVANRAEAAGFATDHAEARKTEPSLAPPPAGLDDDEIEILDLVAAEPEDTQLEDIQPESPKKNPEHILEIASKTIKAEASENTANPITISEADLEKAIAKWIGGPGNSLIRRMIKQEISAIFKATFKD